MAKVNKMEKQVNNLEKNVGKGSKVRLQITDKNALIQCNFSPQFCLLYNFFSHSFSGDGQKPWLCQVPPADVMRGDHAQPPSHHPQHPLHLLRHEQRLVLLR